MCLGELAQVVQLGPGTSATVRLRERIVPVSLLTLDEAVVPGDWVLCHSGFALGRLTAEDAAAAGAIRATATETATPQTSTAPPRKGTP